MSADTVSGENESVDEQVIEQPAEQVVEEQAPESPVEEQAKEQNVPLAALQKERRKRQEMEQELRWHKEQMMQKQSAQPEQEDESLYEAATKKDLGASQQQIIRAVEENQWIKNNPEKAEDINVKLTDFLKLRPNLASAIESATNRYEEAWELMDKLTPKQKAVLKTAAVQRDAPGSPGSVPKAAALNQSVDVMSMSDSEYTAWRQSQRKRR